MENKKRKICFIITSSIHYSRSKLILQELKKHPLIELQIVVGASAILPNYGDVLGLMEKDGFDYDAKIIMTLEGGTSLAMAKTTGLGITEFATVFDNLSPDVVVVRGDRYEVLAAAIAAAYLNIPVAHLEGGDITGSIDESVRHAVTKLAHIHFPTNEESKGRIVRMGEKHEYVFNVGCPGLEFIAKSNCQISNESFNRLGVGDLIDLDQPFLMVMQHPVTTEVGLNRKHAEEILWAIHDIKMPTVWFWPNIDAGTDEISKAIRIFRENNNPKHIRFIKNLPPEEFIGLLKKTACLVGNSSAGIKECSFLGVPVVNVGSRQAARHRSHNVVDVNYERSDIEAAIKKQINHGKYEPDYFYHQEDTSKKIVDVLSCVGLYTQKRFVE